ncbi:MAG TPA: hypothetical protein V6D47_19360 [Oscillatoriaceae cyanobacterium]
MRRYSGATLAALVVLTACQNPNGILERPANTGHLQPSPTAAPSSKPSATASTPAGKQSPSTPPTSPSPSVPTMLLTGLVKLDASYLLAAGGGSVIPAGAGNVIPAGAGNVIAAGAGNVIAAGAGNVIAAGAGNVIAAGGGNVIAAGAGNVIAAGGGNVIAAGAGNYRIFGFNVASTEAIAPGTMLPVKGMMVVPISLDTGKPLGPSVLTDGTGAYQVTVPQGTTENVLIYAAVPATSANDPRFGDPHLRVGTVVDPQNQTTGDIDEDVSLATKYIFIAFATRLTDVLMEPDVTKLIDDLLGGQNISDFPLKAQMQPVLAGLRAQVDAAHVPMNRVARAELAYQISDAVLAHLSADQHTDLADVALSPLYGDGNPTSSTTAAINALPADDKKALNMAVLLLKTVREDAAAKLAQDPAFFAQSKTSQLDPPYTIPWNHCEPTTMYPMTYANELGDYVVREIIGANGEPDPERPGQSTSVLDQELPPILDSIGAKTVQGIDSMALVRATTLSFLLPAFQELQQLDPDAATATGLPASGRNTLETVIGNFSSDATGTASDTATACVAPGPTPSPTGGS